MKTSRINGVGHCLPEQTLATADESLREATGIASRHIVSRGETTGDLAEVAARAALDAAAVDVGDVDMLIVGTTTPDVVFPNLGSLLQERLGISGCPAFSLEASSSGFVYALNVADRFIAGGQTRNALVIGADALSRFSPAETQLVTGTLFGDAAGAVLLGPGQADSLLACRLGAAPRARGADAKTFLQLSDADELGAQLAAVRASCDALLDEHGLTLQDVDWLIPHQSCADYIERTRDALAIDPDRCIVTLAEHGNAGVASIPAALSVSIAEGRIRRGDRVLLVTAGAGFTWGAAILRY